MGASIATGIQGTKNGIIINCSRVDYGGNISNASGFIRIDNDSGDFTSLFTVDDLVTVIYEDINTGDLRTGSGKVTGKNFTGSTTQITTDIPIPSDYQISGAVLNNNTTRQNFKIQLQFFKPDTTTLLFNDIFEFELPPSAIRYFDASDLIRSRMQQIDQPTFANSPSSVISYQFSLENRGDFINFYFKHREVWDGNTNPAWSNGNQSYAVFGKPKWDSYSKSNYGYNNNLFEYGNLTLERRYIMLGSGSMGEFYNTTRTGGSYQNWSYHSASGTIRVTGLSNYLTFNLPNSMLTGTGSQKTFNGLFLRVKLYFQAIGGNIGDYTIRLNNGTTQHTILATGSTVDFDTVNGAYDRVEFAISDIGTATEVRIWGIEILPRYATPLSNVLGRQRAWIGFPFVLSFLSSGTPPSFDIYYLDNTGATISSDLNVTSSAGLVHLIFGQLKIIDQRTATIMIVCSTYKNIYVDVSSPCKNPVMLWGYNSMGGLMCWVFENRQEITYQVSSGRLARRYKLFTDGLTFEQWESLNDLNQERLTYDVNYGRPISGSLSLVGTRRQLDQYLWLIFSDGSYRGVIVNPTKNETLTDRATNEFQIEVETIDI